MGCLGNLLWFVFGGALSGLKLVCWPDVSGALLLWGIPIGMQCFKFASLSFFLLEKKCGMEAGRFPCW